MLMLNVSSWDFIGLGVPALGLLKEESKQVTLCPPYGVDTLGVWLGRCGVDGSG